MRGHLQRMAASAARPERRVHPLVGGLFMKEPQPAAGEGIREISETAVSPVQTMSAGPVGRTEARTESGTAETRDARAVELLVGRGLYAAESVQPAQAAQIERTRREVRAEMGGRERREKSEGASAAVSEAGVSGIANFQPLVQEFELRTEESAKAEREREVVESGQAIKPLEVQTLLVPDTKVEYVEKELSRSEERLASLGSARRERHEQAANELADREESRRGSEDIQIHIGRIEVIAVPQPVQRSAPTQTRKSEGLDEYLRRRERRVR